MILKDTSLLQVCSHDETHGLKPVLPSGVAQPTTTAEVQAIVRDCVRRNTPITCRGTGTGKAGGCVPSPGAVVVDFSKMNRILEISRENLTARVQPGVVLGDFREACDAQGLFYSPDPNSLKWCTLGGNVATNAAGPSALKYGSTRDYVLGLEVVLASGEIARLGKNTVKGVAGYDLVSLVCGSEGTLALVTEITLKLLPKPRAIQTALLIFDSNEAALLAVNRILEAGYLPKTLEYMDASCMHGKPALIVECDGDDGGALENALVQMLEVAKPVESRVASSEKQRREIWEHRRLMSERLKARAQHKISEDIVVPRNQILNFTQELWQLGKKHGVDTAAFGHAGDGNLHAQIFFNGAIDIDKILHELFEITIKLNGTISGEHGIGLAKKAYLPLEQNELVLNLQRAIKKVWDPGGLLNPGKIF